MQSVFNPVLFKQVKIIVYFIYFIMFTLLLENKIAIKFNLRMTHIYFSDIYGTLVLQNPKTFFVYFFL